MVTKLVDDARMQENIDKTKEYVKDNAVIQVTTMPTASSTLAGKVYQYIGTTGTYTHGYFYECKSSGSGYEWVNVPLGSSDISAYHTDDTAETTIADGDYFPFYDTSASGKRKSLWSNIKSVLKTYFDGIYLTSHQDISGKADKVTSATNGHLAGLDSNGNLTDSGSKASDFLTSHQTIKQDGVTGATVNRFGTCSTAAGTAAKTVSITTGTFSIEAGARVSVKFNNANTASTPTLNVNSKGAKNIYHKGSQITSDDNKALLAGTVDFIYDGTQFHLVGNYIDDSGTVYTDNAEHIIGSIGGKILYQKCIHAVVNNPGSTNSYEIDVTNLASTAYGGILMIDPKSFILLYPDGGRNNKNSFMVTGQGKGFGINYIRDAGNVRKIVISQNITGTSKLEYYVFVNYTKASFT